MNNSKEGLFTLQSEQQQQHQPSSVLKKRVSLYTPPTPSNMFTSRRSSVQPTPSSSVSSLTSSSSTSSSSFSHIPIYQKLNANLNTIQSQSTTPTNNNNNNNIMNQLNSIPITPISKNPMNNNKSIGTNTGTIKEETITPISMPKSIRKSVTMSAVKTIHSYPKSPSIASAEKTPLYDDDDADDSAHNLSSASFLNYSTNERMNGMDEDMNNVSAESIYYSNSTASTPARIRQKSPFRKIKDTISYPIDKYFELHQEFILFTNSPLFKLIIFGFCGFLNFLLLLVSLDFLSKMICGTLLLLVSVINCLFFTYSTKTVQLFRYKGKIDNPNMYVDSITTPYGSTDNIVLIDVWNPHFVSSTIVTYFSPLQVLIMIMSGQELDKFIVLLLISILLIFGIHFILKMYDQKLKDEKVVFSQVCSEYNHFYKPTPVTRSIGVQAPY
ncbi:transmembrane protein [Cavenderia fasciculata]|uniref:Transmembrane protein n=1 Tax=Cavenderia fasciculata TaxID=261658 RepID=F4Q4Z5_CACFS|nr:uncharacterized protein DFA_08083 [Cavenderia fasciculata]EGG17101.1 transmembrane protein [Cavenderia fasciculata]|eukprot:XP_004355585.1 transmembrane protein [Cavenderia fasciculata]